MHHNLPLIYVLYPVIIVVQEIPNLLPRTSNNSLDLLTSYCLILVMKENLQNFFHQVFFYLNLIFIYTALDKKIYVVYFYISL